MTCEQQIDKWIVTIRAAEAQISRFVFLVSSQATKNARYYGSHNATLHITLLSGKGNLQHSVSRQSSSTNGLLVSVMMFLSDKAQLSRSQQASPPSVFVSRVTDACDILLTSYSQRHKQVRGLRKTLCPHLERLRKDGGSKVLFIKPSIPRKVTSFKQTLCLNATASITCRHVLVPP